jgi:hypothetical protein
MRHEKNQINAKGDKDERRKVRNRWVAMELCFKCVYQNHKPALASKSIYLT